MRGGHCRAWYCRPVSDISAPSAHQLPIIHSPLAMRVLLAVLVICLLSTGCQPDFVTINNLHRLQKGMTRAQVSDVLPKDPTMQRQITVDGVRYTIDDYPLQTAQAKSETRTYNASMSVTTVTRTTTDYTNILLLLYDNAGLRYWGMIQDYSKSEDPQMQQVAPFLYNLYVTP